MDNDFYLRRSIWKQKHKETYSMTSSSSEADLWSEKQFASSKRFDERLDDSSGSSSSYDDSDSDSSTTSSCSEYEWREAVPVKPPEKPRASIVKIGGTCLPAISRNSEKLVPLKSVLVMLFPNNTPQDLEEGIKKLTIKEVGEYEAKILTEYLTLNSEQDVPKFFVGGEIFVTQICRGDKACTLLSLQENYESILDNLFAVANHTDLSANASDKSDILNKKTSSRKSSTAKSLASFIRPHLALKKKKRQRPLKGNKRLTATSESVNVESTVVKTRNSVSGKAGKSTLAHSDTSSLVSPPNHATDKIKTKESKLKVDRQVNDSGLVKGSVVMPKPKLRHLYPENEEDSKEDGEEEQAEVSEQETERGKTAETSLPSNDVSKEDKVCSLDIFEVEDEDMSEKDRGIKQQVPCENLIGSPVVDNWLSMVSSELLSKSQSEEKCNSDVKVSFIQSSGQDGEISHNEETSLHETESTQSNLENLDENNNVNIDCSSIKENDKNTPFMHIQNTQRDNYMDSDKYKSISGEGMKANGDEVHDFGTKIDFTFTTSRKSVFPTNKLFLNELQSNENPSPQRIVPKGGKELTNLIELFDSLRTSNLNRPMDANLEDSLNTAHSLKLYSESSATTYAFNKDKKTDLERILHGSFQTSDSTFEKRSRIVPRSQKYLPPRERRRQEDDDRPKYVEYSSPMRDVNRHCSSDREWDLQRRSLERRSGQRSRSPSTHSRDSFRSNGDSRRNQKSLSPLISNVQYQRRNCWDSRDSRTSPYDDRGNERSRQQGDRNYDSEEDFNLLGHKYSLCPDYSKLKFDLPEDIYSPLSSSDADFGDYDEDGNFTETDRKKLLRTKSSLDDARQRSIDVINGYARGRVDVQGPGGVGIPEYIAMETNPHPSGSHMSQYYHVGQEHTGMLGIDDQHGGEMLHPVSVQNVETVLPVLAADIDHLVSSIRRDCDKRRDDVSTCFINTEHPPRHERNSHSTRRRTRKRYHSPSMARSLSPRDGRFHEDVPRGRRRSLSPIFNTGVYDRARQEEREARENREYESRFSKNRHRAVGDRREVIDARNGLLQARDQLTWKSSGSRGRSFYDPEQAIRFGGIVGNVSPLHNKPMQGKTFVEFERLWADNDRGSRQPLRHNRNSDLSRKEQQFTPEVDSTHSRSFKPVERVGADKVFTHLEKSASIRPHSGPGLYHQIEWNMNHNPNQVTAGDDQVVIILKQNKDDDAVSDNLWPFESSESSCAESSNEDSCDSEVEGLMFNKHHGSFHESQTVGSVPMNHIQNEIVQNISLTIPVARSVVSVNQSVNFGSLGMNREEGDDDVGNETREMKSEMVVEGKRKFDLCPKIDGLNQPPDHCTESKIIQQNVLPLPISNESLAVIEVPQGGELISVDPSIMEDREISTTHHNVNFHGAKDLQDGKNMRKRPEEVSLPLKLLNAEISTEETKESSHLENTNPAVPIPEVLPVSYAVPDAKILIKEPEPESSSLNDIHTVIPTTEGIPASSNVADGNTPTGIAKELSNHSPVIPSEASQPVAKPNCKKIAKTDAKSWKKKLLRKAQENAGDANFDENKVRQVMSESDIPGQAVSSAESVNASVNLPEAIPYAESSASYETAESVQTTGSVNEAKNKEAPGVKLSDTPEKPYKSIEVNNVQGETKFVTSSNMLQTEPETKTPEVDCDNGKASMDNGEISSSVLPSNSKTTDVVANKAVGGTVLRFPVTLASSSNDNSAAADLSRKKTVVQGVNSDEKSGRLFSRENLNTSITISSTPRTKPHSDRPRQPGSLASRINFRGPQMRSKSIPLTTVKNFTVSSVASVVETTNPMRASGILVASKPISSSMNDQNDYSPVDFESTLTLVPSVSLNFSRVDTSADSTSVGNHADTIKCGGINSNHHFPDPVSQCMDNQDSENSSNKSTVCTPSSSAAVSLHSPSLSTSPPSSTIKPLKSILRKPVNATATPVLPPVVVSTHGTEIPSHFAKSSNANARKTFNLVKFSLDKPGSNKQSVTPHPVHRIRATGSEATPNAQVAFCQVTSSGPVCALAEAVSSIIAATPSIPRRKKGRKVESVLNSESEEIIKAKKIQPNSKKRGRPPKKGSKGKSGKRKRLPSISSDDDLIEELQASANAEPKENLVKLVSREKVFSSTEEDESDNDLVSFMKLKDADRSESSDNRDHSENETHVEATEDEIPLYKLKKGLQEGQTKTSVRPNSSQVIPQEEVVSSKDSSDDKISGNGIDQKEMPKATFAKETPPEEKNGEESKPLQALKEGAAADHSLEKIGKLTDFQLPAAPKIIAQEIPEDIKSGESDSYENIFSKMANELDNERIKNGDLELGKSSQPSQPQHEANSLEDIGRSLTTPQTIQEAVSEPALKENTISGPNTTLPELSTLRVVLSSVETIPSREATTKLQQTEYPPRKNEEKAQEGPKTAPDIVQPILPTPPISPVTKDDRYHPSQESAAERASVVVGGTVHGPNNSNFTESITTPKSGDTSDQESSREISEEVSRMPEGDSCHGFLEVCMSAPGPFVYALRRIPYVKTTTSNSGQNLSNNATNAANVLPTSSACATYLRLRDIIFLLKLQPESLWSLIHRSGVNIFQRNSFTRRLFETVYDPVCSTDLAMHKLTMRYKQGEHVQEFLDRMIILDEYLHTLLPKFYSEALRIESFDVPKFVNVKIFKPISNIDEEVIKIFSKPYEYNAVLQTKDDKVKCQTMKKKKILTLKAQRKRSGEGPCKGTRNKRKKSNDATPTTSTDFAAMTVPTWQSHPGVSLHPQGFYLVSPGNLNRVDHPPLMLGQNFHPLEFSHSLNHSIHSQFNSLGRGIGHHNFAMAPMQQATQVNLQPREPNVQSRTELQERQLTNLSANCASQIGRPTVIQSTNAENVTNQKVNVIPPAQNLPIASNLTPDNGTMETNNANASRGVSMKSDWPQRSTYTRDTIRDVVAEAFVSEVGFKITSVFSLKSDPGSKNKDKADQYSDITESSSDNDKAAPNKTPSSLLTTKEYLKNASKVLSQQNRAEPLSGETGLVKKLRNCNNLLKSSLTEAKELPENTPATVDGASQDPYDLSSESQDVRLKGANKSKVLKQLPLEKDVDNCHLSGVVSKLKARVDSKKRKTDGCHKKGGKAKGANMKKSK